MTSEFDAAMGLVFLEGAEIWTRDVRRRFTDECRAGQAESRMAPGGAVEREPLRGLVQEGARVWDSTGRFVVQSRQLCGVRIPADHPPR